MQCCTKIKLYPSQIGFKVTVFYNYLAQTSPQVIQQQIFQSTLAPKWPVTSLALTTLAGHLIFCLLWRESHSGGASIERNFTAETRDLLIFFTRSWESWRLKLGYLILALVKPWMEGGDGGVHTVWCGFDWFLAHSHSDIFHEFMISVFRACVWLC